jgi:hypothetical protein
MKLSPRPTDRPTDLDFGHVLYGVHKLDFPVAALLRGGLHRTVILLLLLLQLEFLELELLLCQALLRLRLLLLRRLLLLML